MARFVLELDGDEREVIRVLRLLLKKLLRGSGIVCRRCEETRDDG